MAVKAREMSSMSNSISRNDFDSLVSARTSVRAFKNTPVPEAILAECVACAGLAPSNCNSQPWSIEIVSGATLARLKAAMVKTGETMDFAPDIPWLEKLYSDELLARQAEHLTVMQTALGIRRDDKAARLKLVRQNFECFGAPHLALLYMPTLGNEREAADLGHFGQTFMLALTARGIASIPQTSIGMVPQTIRGVLGLDYSRKLLYGISIGYELPGLPASRIVQGRADYQEFTRFHP